MAIELQGKRVLVVGMMRSGIAAGRLLASKGATPILNDLKPREALEGLAELEALPCKWQLGQSPEALLSEADLIVISPGVPIQSPWIQKALERGIPLIGELELGAAFAEGPILAITGTNGKTTTTALLGEMFKNAGRVTHVAGNIGAPVCGAALTSRPGDTFVLEVSSFQLETVRDFHPKVATVLNLTPDHLNRHGDMDGYAAVKARVFAQQTEEDVAVFNADDPWSRVLANGSRARKLAFAIKNPEVLSSAQGLFALNGQIVLRMGERERTLCGVEELRLPRAHLQNALAAACMAAAMDVPAPVIRHTLRTFAGLEHRIETLRTWRGVTFINDSKGTNVESTLCAIESMAAPTVIILGGDDKGVSFEVLGQAMAQATFMEAAVLIGKTAGKIREALEEAGFHACHEAGNDFEEAVRLAASLAKQGGNVLLSPACASFDMFRDYEHRGEEFRKIVTALPDDY